MSPLEQRLGEYLALRRSLGYKLERAGLLLGQFVVHIDDAGIAHPSAADCLRWAMLPADGSRWWWAQRLSVVRGFAIWLHNLDPAVEIPPRDLLPAQSPRAVPYMYSPADIAALMDAAATLKGQLRQATYRTLIGLLAATGMRIGEARSLEYGDVDLAEGTLTIRHAKFDKSRILPLHPSTTQALSAYLELRDRLAPPRCATTVFISPPGKPLIACNVESIFRILVARAGLKPRGAARPRIHDLRHSFIVNAVLQGYTHGQDVQARLAVIATYAGHVDPKNTYWYLTTSPELMAVAGQRLEDYLAAAQ